MRFRSTIAPALTALVLGVPAFAGDGGGSNDPLSRLEPQTLFQGMIRESDVSLFFDYLRAAMAAAARGEEAPVPEELQKRAETLGNELKMRSTLSALSLLSAMEAQAKQWLRDGMAPARPKLPLVTPFTATKAD